MKNLHTIQLMDTHAGGDVSRIVTGGSVCFLVPQYANKWSFCVMMPMVCDGCC